METAHEEYNRLVSELRTPKQRAFVLHYVTTLNATEAAARSGYKGTRSTHAQVGYENLRKPEIKAAINVGLEAYSTLSENELLARISRIAQGDISKYIQYKTIEKATNKGDLYTATVAWFDIELFRKDGMGFLLKRFTQGSDGSIRVEFHDPVKALELLGKFYKTWTDTLEVDAKMDQWVFDVPGKEYALQRQKEKEQAKSAPAE